MKLTTHTMCVGGEERKAIYFLVAHCKALIMTHGEGNIKKYIYQNSWRLFKQGSNFTDTTTV
jgi:hypothetical protein